MPQLILTNCFFVFCFVHILYWVILFGRLRPARPHSDLHSTGQTSVVVVFKNELENLKALVPKLIEQAQSNFEIVLCDDFSSDGSYEYVSSIDDPLIRTMQCSQDLPGKKLALKEAINFAQGEIILLTDADCYPTSKNWIRSMTTSLQEKQIVLGYSPHLKKTGWLNRFIRFETYLTALQYFSYAQSGTPYMGVGRNLLYKKNLFLESKALDESSQLISGDDDMFINAVSTANNTAINLDSESFVHTYPSNSFSSFLRQKRRHVTTASSYKLHHQLLLAVYALSHVAVYLLFVLGLVLEAPLPFIIGFIIVLCIKWLIAGRTLKILGCADLSPFFPILDILMVLYYIFLTPATFFKSKNW